MDDRDLPNTEEELLETLRKMRQRQYVKRFKVDRDYARQLEAFGRRHPAFLVEELLRLAGKTYDGIEEKIQAFFDALDSLSEDRELRIKLTHKSLDKTF